MSDGMPWDHTPKSEKQIIIPVPVSGVVFQTMPDKVVQQADVETGPKSGAETGGVTLLRVIEGGKGEQEKGKKEDEGGTREGLEKAWDSLTNKQRAWINAFIGGMSETEAYRHVYSAEKMKPNTVNREASRLMVHPKIATIVKRRLREKEEAALHSAVSRRRFVIERLVERAKESDTHASEIRALELLGKMQGVDLFRDISATPDDIRPKEEVEAEIEKRLLSLFGKG